MAYLSKNLEDTAKIARDFLQTLQTSEISQILEAKNEATVVLFDGDLGAGKTTFIQALARELGVRENITSPTFVIQKRYDLTGQKFDALIHIDAYRLVSGGELLKLDFAETLALPKTLICIEWPENVAEILPKTATKVICKFIDETTHSYEF
jgi:tRNA threonylcarbamoyladenosine biosynthesis protein TsaE